ncbi:MAG: ATP-binding protein [Cytophagales bacterium]|nr:ATP-binding protein [Cytophagales bacterium]
MSETQKKYDVQHFREFILLLAAFIPFYSTSAQDPVVKSSQQIGLPYIQNFTPEDYGACPHNYYITQDQEQLIYVANEQGVLQYDGATWRLIPLSNGSTAYSVATGSDGLVYVGGEGEIGCLTYNEKGDLRYLSLLEKIPVQYRDFSYVWQMAATSRHIFFASDKYFFLWQIDGTDEQMKVWVAKNIFHNCFVLNDEIYVWEWDSGLEQLIGDSLQVVPDGETFKFSTIRLMAPVLNSADGKIFIGTVQHGLFTYDGVKAESLELAPVVKKFLDENSLYNSVPLDDGTYALGTTRGGIAIIDGDGHMVQLLNTSTGLQDETVDFVFPDCQGGLWVASFDGISRIEIPTPFTFFSDDLGLTVDTKGVLYHQDRFYAYGPSGFFQLTEPTPNDYRTHFQLVRGAASQSQVLKMLFIGEDLIVAAHSGVFRLNLDGTVNHIIHYPAHLLQPSRFYRDIAYVGLGSAVGIIQGTSQRWKLKGHLQGINEPVRSIAEASPGRLWVTTIENTFSVQVEDENFMKENTDSKPDSLREIATVIKKFDQSNGLPKGTIYAHNVRGNTIFATSSGFRKFDIGSNTFVPDFSLGYTDTTRSIHTLSVQPNGDIWFVGSNSTDAELIRLKLFPDGSYRQKAQRFRHILSNRTTINAIDIDPSDPDIAWISTSDGLIKYNPKVKKDYEKAFTAFVRKVLANGDSLIFGGSLLNRQSTILNYASNAVRFEYAAPSFDRPAKTRYQVWLEGFDPGWSEWIGEAKKDYTNLPEGDYTFRVKARNVYGEVSKEGSFTFSILPPWYRSWWAYSTYLLLAAGAIYGLLRLRLHQLRLRNQELETLVQERTRVVEEQKERLVELNQVKSRFFTNISHEFRTPLTVIAGMMEQIKDLPDQRVKKVRKIIQRNTSNLLNLVNQILELRKLETGSLELNLIQGDIVSYLRYILESFHSLAERKGISLHFLCDEMEIIMDFDKEKMLRIISNLLSNALRFGAEGGRAYLMASRIPKGRSTPPGLEIKVLDTGIGISEEKLPYIFDYFYQADDSGTRCSEGTGIGLSLTKALVELMKGTIKVESKPGKGTTFIVFLPISEVACVEASAWKTDKVISGILDAHISGEAAPDLSVADLSGDIDKPVVLIIEDNTDLVEYLGALLGNQYLLEVACDGRLGVEKALNKIPDLILCDVMMPEKDGFEVCEMLKKDDRTSHIPIILLTARADVKSRITGLERGADAYLSKPFNEKELKVTLKKLLELRRVLQERYRAFDRIDPSEDEAIMREDAFITRLKNIVEERLTDEAFGIAELCAKIGISRSQLHLKIKALTNRSTSHFIRMIRLQKAKELLQQSDLNISEIAYCVGFQNPAYFSRSFTQEFGISPSEFGKH